MQSLVSYVHRGPSALYLFSGRGVTLLASVLMEFALCMHILSVCTVSFSCKSLLPTLSYAGALRGHDRYFACICSAFALTVPVTVLGLRARFQGAVADAQVTAMTWIGVLCALMLSAVGVVDEINGIYVISLAHVHVWLSMSVLTLTFSLVYLVHSGLEQIQAALSYEELKWKGRLKLLYYAGAALALVTMLQWHFAYTVYSNSLVNENVEALCEWVLATMGVFLPVVLTQFLPNYTLALGVRTKAALEDT